ncbi:class I SAM-dependent methyltransferase [Gorillibacterium sp. sgz500922]|uniref:class I SAM-dependent methyltransferase n=1 Tax=Gorillibacterium sp. sgz500922 TaxID=3446694 RepID=UPI003F672EE2
MAESWNVREQFNKQAIKFDNWTMTQNETNHQFLAEFYGLGSDDELLDLACGTGAFAIYAARRTKAVWGVDISEKMIEVATANARERQVENIAFFCSNVEKVPFENERFSCVSSKAAYHHMKNYQAVFQEMKHYCQAQGRICIQDIIAYDDAKLDDFFERLELVIDPCHHRTLSKQEFVDLYKHNNVEVHRALVSVSPMHFYDYVNHAVQTEEAKAAIEEMVRAGLDDPLISQWLYMKDDTLFWKRKVLTIAGYKR